MANFLDTLKDRIVVFDGANYKAADPRSYFISRYEGVLSRASARFARWWRGFADRRNVSGSFADESRARGHLRRIRIIEATCARHCASDHRSLRDDADGD